MSGDGKNISERKESLKHLYILAPHQRNIGLNCISGFNQIPTFSVESFMLTTKYIIHSNIKSSCRPDGCTGSCHLTPSSASKISST